MVLFVGRTYALRISIVSSSEGSSTVIGWNRRSSAASDSMCLRYSSSVVAPITCSSPRDKAGFNILAASTDEPAAPPHQHVNFINKQDRAGLLQLINYAFESFLKTGRDTSCRPPANPHPAAGRVYSLTVPGFHLPRSAGPNLPQSQFYRRRVRRLMPDCFLVRRARIWITRSISICLPITGSSFFSSALEVKSVAS